MEEIQSLHAATMLAAQQQVNVPFDHSNKPIAPKTEALVLNTPPQPTAAEADAIKETARKLREELEQQQQLMLQQQRYQQEMKRNTSSYESSSPPDNKSPRRYIKTGKYSKKKAQQQPSNPPGPMPPFNPQQLTTLQQSLQTASGSMISANHSHPSSIPSTPTSSSFTPSQPPIGPKPLAEPTAIKPTVGKLTQPLPDSILSKRLPEEEFQHRDIKRRYTSTPSSILLMFVSRLGFWKRFQKIMFQSLHQTIKLLFGPWKMSSIGCCLIMSISIQRWIWMQTKYRLNFKVHLITCRQVTEKFQRYSHPRHLQMSIRVIWKASSIDRKIRKGTHKNSVGSWGSCAV